MHRDKDRQRHIQRQRQSQIVSVSPCPTLRNVFRYQNPGCMRLFRCGTTRGLRAFAGFRFHASSFRFQPQVSDFQTSNLKCGLGT
eukprot:3134869-Rhodomonas_salina.1